MRISYNIWCRTERRNLGGEERRNWRETRGTENGETVKETNEIGKNFLSMLKVILLIIIVYIIKKWKGSAQKGLDILQKKIHKLGKEDT